VVLLVGPACATFDPNADASAVDGPASQADAQVSADAPCIAPMSPQTFVFSGSVEMFTIPMCVQSITVEAFGAAGGDGVVVGGVGGQGARVRGTFDVVPGDMLTILVGGRGVDGVPFAMTNGQGGGTGGGGTFVLLAGNPAVIAGGGGGASSNDNPMATSFTPGGAGSITEDGLPGGGVTPGAGGTMGGGGTSGSNSMGFHVGTAGGGFSGDGIGASDGIGVYGTPNQPGQSFLNGGAGGAGGAQGRSGGIGGGGAAGFTGGGGGGYSGGGSSSLGGTYGGGGGGSFNAGTDPDAEAGVREGDGEVVISW